MERMKMKIKVNQTTNSSSLFNQNSLLEQNQDKNNENKQQILLKEEQQNIEDLLPKKRKKSFKICKCFPTVVRVIVESGAKEIEEEIEERIITSSSSTSQLQLNNYNNTNIFTTKHSLTIMASSSSGGGGGGGISRFRIIPVNSNYYKKGRWQVWDYYNEGIVDKKTTNTNNILQPKENKIEKESEEEQKKENDISPKIGNTSFNYENESKINPPPPSILSLQNIPTSTSKLMPRRNSFQLITIKTLEDKNSLNSVPSSISEERLNLIGVNDNTKENNLIKNWIKQQNSSEFITFPPPHQNNKTPQIVEEPPQKLSEFPSYPLLNNHQPISIESTTTTNLVSTISSPSPNSLSPNIKSISTSPPPPPKQMFIQPPPPSSLERQLSVGLNEKEIKENNSPQQQQYFSASFGPGQIQFNGNMNGVGGQNYVEERRRSIARRWVLKNKILFKGILRDKLNFILFKRIKF
uniref:Uncharacterized protein n=1 Tax=Meloidogyne enterolobii TaxID=390850 RepID=A0A6V7U3W4_MELEN|nr:unnamed protein product [Meloidogyne enterolobii]